MEEHSMIHEALQRIMDTVLLSRVPQLKRTKDQLSLLLVAPTAGYVREALRDRWRRSGAPTYRIDITCLSPSSSTPILLERWEISHCIEREVAVEDINAQLMRSYKRITVMLRTLYSFCRIVPAYQIFNSVKSSTSELMLDFLISVQDDNGSGDWEPLFGNPRAHVEFNTQATKFFTLPEIISPHGRLNICVKYRNEVECLQSQQSQQTDFNSQTVETNSGEQKMHAPSGLGALLKKDDRSHVTQSPYTRSPYEQSRQTHAGNYSMSLPPSGKNATFVKGSGPMSIPSSSTNASGGGMASGGRARSRSDHIYSKSEGHRAGPFWPPSDTLSKERKDEHVGSFGGAAPFLIVEASSANSDSSLTGRGHAYTPPLGYINQPNSLLSSSPQVSMDQRPYSAASMIHSTHMGQPGANLLSQSELEEFNSLPESPFTRSSLDKKSPFGHDSSLEGIGGGSSIFSSMHGLNLGDGPSMNNFMSHHLNTSNVHQNALNEVSDDRLDDASFQELPFACNDLDEDSNVDTDRTASSSYSSSQYSSLPVSSFVSLVESAPKLSLFEPNLNDQNDNQRANYSNQLSIDDELREFQLFGEALRS